MGKLFNVLDVKDKLYDGPVRNMDPTFGYDYFDNTRDTGYGGYSHQPGRWKPVAERVIKAYDLKPGAKMLDLGSAKGFFMEGFVEAMPDAEVRGIDVSQYAYDNSLENMRPFLTVGSCDDLSQFEDNYFDMVCGMNVLHFLTPERAEVALKEIMRVGKGKYFVQVDAYTNEVERERLLAWAPIIKTVYSVDDWLALFKKVGYDGDYYWTMVRPENSEK